MNHSELNFYSAATETTFALALLVACAFAFAGFVYALNKISKSRKNMRLQRFLLDEEGATYSFSFVMILPVYLTIMCVALEMTFLLVAKFGTVRAAQAAARAAAVRTAVKHPSERPLPGQLVTLRGKMKAQQAAVEAIVPFAGAFDPDNQKETLGGKSYYRAYADYIKGVDDPAPTGTQKLFGDAPQTVNQKCVTARYASAQNRVSVALLTQSPQGKNPSKEMACQKLITARVTYEAPYRIALVGRLFGGKKSGKAVVASIHAEASVQAECPRNNTGFLGVALPWGL